MPTEVFLRLPKEKQAKIREAIRQEFARVPMEEVSINRIVQQAGISCREAFYDYDPDDLNGMHAAEALKFPPEQVFKTLVAKGAKTGIHVFCIPVCCELDLKKAAKVAADKSIAMVPVKELLGLTGYIRGGCSPVGMKK